MISNPVKISSQQSIQPDRGVIGYLDTDIAPILYPFSRWPILIDVAMYIDIPVHFLGLRFMAKTDKFAVNLCIVALSGGGYEARPDIPVFGVLVVVTSEQKLLSGQTIEPERMMFLIAKADKISKMEDYILLFDGRDPVLLH